MKRDYNKELKDTQDHKYVYSFDYDVMHPFMISYKTKKFYDVYDKIIQTIF